jgi:hypothetical protein
MKSCHLIIIALTLFASCSSNQNISNKQNAEFFPEEITVTRESKKPENFSLGEIWAGRDLDKYVKGGPFVKFATQKEVMEQHKKDDEKLRDFIWQNWTSKVRAYAQADYGGIDSSAAEYIFIEPNRSNEWMVNIKMFGRHTMPEYDKVYTESPTAYKVERVDGEPQKGEWAIVLKDKNDSIIKKIPEYK